MELYNQINEGGVGTPLTASIFFGDHPIPSRTFLLQGGGNIISDCSAHDVDYIRWTLKDEVVSVYATGTSSDDELKENGVIDNATMIMKFSKGTIRELLCFVMLVYMYCYAYMLLCIALQRLCHEHLQIIPYLTSLLIKYIRQGPW